MQILQRRNEYMQILQRRRGGEWLAVYKYERMRAILASLYLFVDMTDQMMSSAIFYSYSIRRRW